MERGEKSIVIREQYRWYDCVVHSQKAESGQTWLLENWIGDLAVIVNFPLEDDPNILMVAWTTTPWTLPSNLALCVHPDLVYVKVQGELTFWNISRLLFFSYTTQSQSLCYSVGLFFTNMDYFSTLFLPHTHALLLPSRLTGHSYLSTLLPLYSLSHFHCMYIRMCVCAHVHRNISFFFAIFVFVCFFHKKGCCLYHTNKNGAQQGGVLTSLRTAET